MKLSHRVTELIFAINKIPLKGAFLLLGVYITTFSQNTFGMLGNSQPEFFSDQYKIKNFSSYSFKSCEEYNKNQNKAPFYYISHQSKDYIQKLRDSNGQIQAIKREELEKDFLSNLHQSSLRLLENGIYQLESLKSCLTSKNSSAKCEEITKSSLSLIKKELPKVRVLMSMKDTPSHTFSVEESKRYQNENLIHDFTGIQVPDLTKDEMDYLDEYTLSLASEFRQEVMNSNDIKGLKSCVVNSNESIYELKESKECEKFEYIINYHVQNLFKEQYKVYQESYQKLISLNPLLSFLELNGTESDEDIKEEVRVKIDKLIYSTYELHNEVLKYQEDEYIELLGINGVVNDFIRNNPMPLNTCNFAENLKKKLNSSQLKHDLLIAAGALVGGGVCALSGGMACFVGVGAGAELMYIFRAQHRYEAASTSFLAGQGSLSSIEDNLFHRNLTLFLAPLAVVGGGQMTYLGRNFSRLMRLRAPQNIKNLKIKSLRARVVRLYESDKSAELVKKLEKFVSFQTLSYTQKDLFYHQLLSLNNAERAFFMRALDDSPSSKILLEKLDGADIPYAVTVLKNTFKFQHIMPRHAFVIGGEYKVRFGHASKVLRVRVTDFTIDENGIGRFALTDDVGRILTFIPKDRFGRLMRLGTRKKNTILSRVGNPITYPFRMTEDKYQNWLRLMYRPFVKVREGNKVSFYADTFPTKRLKDASLPLMQSIEKFDDDFVRLGFNKPYETKVIFKESSLVSKKNSHTYTRGIYNIWDRDRRVVISMNPENLRDSRRVYDEGILLHERAHDLIDATYNKNAFVSKNTTINEAFADYFYALNKHNPRIGKETSDSLFIRNIKSRQVEYDGKVFDVKDILNMAEIPSHHNSVFVSHLMWKLKEMIGHEEVGKILIPLFDNLNTHRSSFVNLRLYQSTISNQQVSSLNITRQIKDLEYFFSMIIKTLKQKNMYSVNVERLIKDKIEEYGLNQRLIARIDAKVKSDGHDYKFKNAHLALDKGIEPTALTRAITNEVFLAYYVLLGTHLIFDNVVFVEDE